MLDWREFLKGERSRSAIKAIEEHFKYRGIVEPTLNQIKSISKEDLLDMVICIPTYKNILLLQQKIEE